MFYPVTVYAGHPDEGAKVVKTHEPGKLSKAYWDEFKNPNFTVKGMRTFVCTECQCEFRSTSSNALKCEDCRYNPKFDARRYE